MIKPASEMQRDEFCTKCSLKATRLFLPQNIYLNKTKVTFAEYNPGLGKVIKNEHHLREECKKQNLTPVGNDFGSGEKMQTGFDKAREDKRAREWEAL